MRSRKRPQKLQPLRRASQNLVSGCVRQVSSIGVNLASFFALIPKVVGLQTFHVSMCDRNGSAWLKDDQRRSKTYVGKSGRRISKRLRIYHRSCRHWTPNLVLNLEKHVASSFQLQSSTAVLDSCQTALGTSMGLQFWLTK